MMNLWTITHNKGTHLSSIPAVTLEALYYYENNNKNLTGCQKQSGFHAHFTSL